jgi:hypothetical protein
LGQSPIPNPQSPIPNPHTSRTIILMFYKFTNQYKITLFSFYN